MKNFFFYLAVFLVSFATLTLEIVQTRILSVVVWYHLAFFVISLAMFGLTAGAVWVHQRRERFSAKTLSYDLSYFSGLFGLTSAICLAIQMTLAPVITRLATTLWVWSELALCVAVPFFFSGVALSLALTRSGLPIARVYGIDLLGAAGGALGALFLLEFTDGPSAVLWVAVIALLGALAFAKSAIGGVPEHKPLHVWLWRRPWLIFVVAFFALINPYWDQGLQPIAVKGKFEFPGTHVLRQWNSFSRVDVSPVFRGAPIMWGPSPKLFEKRWSADQVDLFIDGDAGTTAYRFDGDGAAVEFVKFDVTNLAYFLPGRTRGAVIGVGGGRDVLAALLFGLKEVTAVELNPILVDLQTQRDGLLGFTKLASIPGVRFFADEGRSWMARSREMFDVIQMSLVDTWAATGAGAFSLSENGLYTVAAWKIFLGRLTPAGVLTVSRWYEPSSPDETGRMISLAVAALMDAGISQPRRHLFLAAQGRIATLVLAKSPLAPNDLQALQAAAQFYQHQVLISPDREPSSTVLAAIVNAPDRTALEKFTSSQAFDLTPPTDDRPFFFNQLAITRPLQALAFAREVLGTTSEGGGVRRGNLVATFTLLLLFLIAALLVGVTLIVPLRFALRDVGARLVIYGSSYFSLIGAGFMAIEIGLMQRMSVFLGHPVYSLAVLLFTLILSTGIGSLVSETLPLNNRARLIIWGGSTAGYLVILTFSLTTLFTALESATLLPRIIACVAAIVPAGMLLGFAFPTGIRLVAAIDERPTAWFWGINGATGVLASIAAVAVSLALGISATLILGALCYLILIPVSLQLLESQKNAAARVSAKIPSAPRKSARPSR